MKISIYQITVPLKKHFTHAAASRTVAESVFFVIERDGYVGVGECAPRSYVTQETSDTVFQALSTLCATEGVENLEWFNLGKYVAYQQSPNAYCAIEMALLDLYGKKQKQSLAEVIKKCYLPEAVILKQNLFKTTQVLDLNSSVMNFIQQRAPFHCIKIKVNQDLTENMKRVRTIRQALNDNIPIIIDANMAWDYTEAVKHITALRQYNISYFEEPLAKGMFEEYSELKEQVKQKILLDESLCNLDDAKQAVYYQACDAFNIRISKCGGLSHTIDLVKYARANHIAFQLGAQVAELGPLIAAGRHLRAVLDDAFTFEAGQPDFLLQDYIIKPMPLVDRNTNLALPIVSAGLGIELMPNLHKYIKRVAHFSFGQRI